MTETIFINKALNGAIKDEDVLKALESLIDVYKEQKQKNHVVAIPLSLFADRKLGSLEVIVKYMKENLFMTYSQIATLLKRDQRTIWSTYHNADAKHKTDFSTMTEEYMVPCEIFSKRTQGPLEVLVVYLKDSQGLSFKKISEILNRNYSTIWLSYKNGKKHG